MQIIGTKYQKYVDDELKVRRITKIKSNNSYIVKEKDSDQKFEVENDDLTTNYVRIAPDAFLNIMITKEPSFEGKEVNDVYFCVNRACDLVNKSDIPSLILRQNYYSNIKNMYASTFNEIWIGECATIMTSSKKDLQDMIQFEKIKSKISIALYLDDSEEDIISLIPNKFKKDINATLILIKQTMPPMCSGACETVEELFKENDFIGNYKSIFNITKIDFPIVLGKESYNDDGDIILNSKQFGRIQNILRRYISNIKILKYDKDIDVSRIVNTQHVIVCDSNNDIFLIAYTVDGYYADNEDDRDVLRSMGYLA